ncbi:hypothetical protein EDB89DRAFT_1908826 [Lactarius sanguifluus]|nr:hypothetical protein EDB89DRAFT_1908826 [Lactarius sanguifluus]
MIVQDTEPDAKYRCTDCNLQFGTPRDLSRHLNKTARHGGQPSPCAICHKPLTRPDSRARHERRCRERFGVTEEMWRGIERERQRGRRKSVSIDGVDALSAVAESAGESSGMSGGGIPHERRAGPSRSRTVSISEISDAADLATAFASARVASSAPGPASASPIIATRFVAQPGAPGSWTRGRSTSLRAGPLHPPPGVALNNRPRHPDASSPPSRSTLPPPPPPHTHWHALNQRLARDESPPFDPPSSPTAMQDESDGESVGAPYRSRMPALPHPHWTTLSPDAEDDAEVDELAGGDEEELWHPPTRAHGPMRTPESAMTPPPKKKLFGFESQTQGTGAGGPACTEQRIYRSGAVLGDHACVIDHAPAGSYGQISPRVERVVEHRQNLTCYQGPKAKSDTGYPLPNYSLYMHRQTDTPRGEDTRMPVNRRAICAGLLLYVVPRPGPSRVRIPWRGLGSVPQTSGDVVKKIKLTARRDGNTTFPNAILVESGILSKLRVEGTPSQALNERKKNPIHKGDYPRRRRLRGYRDSRRRVKFQAANRLWELGSLEVVRRPLAGRTHADDAIITPSSRLSKKRAVQCSLPGGYSTGSDGPQRVRASSPVRYLVREPK